MDRGEVGYLVVTPPAGAFIDPFPQQAYTVTHGDASYFVHGPAFCVAEMRNGRRVCSVVEAPLGARIPVLPERAILLPARGERLYVYDRTVYRQVHGPERPAWEVGSRP